MSKTHALRKYLGIGMRTFGVIQIGLMAIGALILAVADRMTGAVFPGPMYALLAGGIVQGAAYLAIGVWLKRTGAAATRSPLIAAMVLTGLGVVGDLVFWGTGTYSVDAAGIVGVVVLAALFSCAAVALRVRPSGLAGEPSLEAAG